MRLHRFRNRMLQCLYRPGPPKPFVLHAGVLAQLDAIDKAVDEKITPLLAGLFEE